jgi:hypothetical protein
VRGDLSGRDERTVQQEYSEWVYEQDDYQEIEQELRREWVSDNKSDYYNDFITQKNLEDEFAEWQEENDSDDAEDFISENLASSFDEYMDELSFEEDFSSEAWEQFTDDNPIDEWANRRYGSVYNMLVELTSWQPEGGGVEEVAQVFTEWTDSSSEFKEVQAGEYHQGAGVDNDYWRVEEDSSIDADSGSGAEIISPVYSTPRQMLTEMTSLFEFFKSKGVETNKSTGLHVTMSWTRDSEAPLNKLKMAVLLGDQYLLKQFGREFNNYTQSQMKKVQQHVDALSTNSQSTKDLRALEKEISQAVSSDRRMSINFKSETNEDDNQLIEFRIGGGQDYHRDIKLIEKAVVRYATIMRAGHDPKAYYADYVKALVRLFTKKENPKYNPEVVASLEQEFKSVIDKVPLVKTLTNIISVDRYDTFINNLKTAYEYLERAKETRSQDTQPQLFTEADDAEARDWQTEWQAAQDYFLRALTILVYDLARGKTRGKVTPGTVVQLRKAAQEFNLTYDQIWKKLNDSIAVNQLGGNYQARALLQKTVSSLFKRQVGRPEQPQFTVKVDLERERLYMPEKVAEGALAEPPTVTLKPSDFIVVPADDIQIVLDARYLYDQYKVKSEQARNQLEYYTTQVDPQDRNDATIQQLTQALENSERIFNQVKPTIDEFLQKYRFVPPTRNTGSEPMGFAVRQIFKQSDLDQLSRTYNIAFVK